MRVSFAYLAKLRLLVEALFDYVLELTLSANSGSVLYCLSELVKRLKSLCLQFFAGKMGAVMLLIRWQCQFIS